MSHTRNQMRAQKLQKTNEKRRKKFTLQKSIAETFIKWPRPGQNQDLARNCLRGAGTKRTRITWEDMHSGKI